MEFEINIGISNETMQFTGHWLTKCENWEAAMKRASTYADLFAFNEGCTNIDYINVRSKKAACDGE